MLFTRTVITLLKIGLCQFIVRNGVDRWGINKSGKEPYIRAKFSFQFGFISCPSINVIIRRNLVVTVFLISVGSEYLFS